MLKKNNRLSKKEFNRFFSLGKRSHTPHLLLVYAPAPTFKAAVVVSKKVARHAVARNRLRRQVYEILREHTKQQELVGVYIFVVKQNTPSPTFNILRDEISFLLGHLHKAR